VPDKVERIGGKGQQRDLNKARTSQPRHYGRDCSRFYTVLSVRRSAFLFSLTGSRTAILRDRFFPGLTTFLSASGFLRCRQFPVSSSVPFVLQSNSMAQRQAVGLINALPLRLAGTGPVNAARVVILHNDALVTLSSQLGANGGVRRQPRLRAFIARLLGGECASS
jgi:hypothetical protein